MLTNFGLCCRSNDRSGELLVFFHTLRQLYTTNLAYTAFVSTPCTTAKVATYNHLDGEALTHNAYRDHRVGGGQLPVGADVGSCVQEFGGNLVEHLSLERNAFGQDNIECWDTVGCYHGQTVAKVINVTYFTMINTLLSRKMEIGFC